MQIKQLLRLLQAMPSDWHLNRYGAIRNEVGLCPIAHVFGLTNTTVYLSPLTITARKTIVAAADNTTLGLMRPQRQIITRKALLKITNPIS